MQSVRALLHGIVDYAGLFPPAKLDMGDAVRRYAEYHAGPDAWALGRFVLPVARLEEFGEVYDSMREKHRGEPWRLSALTGADLKADVDRIGAFNRDRARRAGGAVVDAVELRAASTDEVARAAALLPSGVEAFFEIPVASDPRALVGAIARAGAGAKVRTGGITPDAFPSVEELARFLHACVRADVPFKATAGLHHPLRAEYRLTYEPDSATGTMFGFINVFLAAALFRAGGTIGDAQAMLAETSPAAFRFDDSGVTWRGHRLGNAELEAGRERAVSFGSCSFREPVDDLQALDLLPAT